MDNQTEYDLKSLKLPRLAGNGLKLFASLIENPATRWVLLGSLLNNAGITKFRQIDVEEPPTYLPLYPRNPAASDQLNKAEFSFWSQLDKYIPKQKGFAFRSVLDYAQAYQSGITTPEEIAQLVLEAVEASQKSSPAMNIMIAQDHGDLLAQARASGLRIREGQAISILDGVPIAVKDEVDQIPYPTTVGTSILGTSPARSDSTVVARMRSAGAMLIGKANMHEIGIGVTGLNPHFGTVRNPYNIQHHTGGSSSGSAAAVASGLCPIAIGADGGGSIRIPSAFCGLVGLKPTFGRVSEFGAAPLTWSMGHLGPIAASALDAALGYSILAGPDPRDPNTLFQPGVTLDKLTDLDLSDLVLGVYWPWFRHASPDIVGLCEKMLLSIQSLGARVEEVKIPSLEEARVAHVITISTEMTTALDNVYREHQKDFALDTRLNLALARTFSARDYIKAQRVRTRAIASFEKALSTVDVIVTPTTGITAPPVRPDAQPDGESDLSQLTEIMRFILYPNLTGHPAISFPAGYDSQGLPVGFQAIGRPWQEHVLLRLAIAGSQFVERDIPQVYYPLLQAVN